MSPSLESVQAAFADALLDAAVAAPLADALVESGALLDARLALYRRHVSATWRAALELQYPVLQALLGADCFSDLAARYGRAHPSRHGDVNRFGAGFAAFVANDAVLASLPYLGDVAALEACLHRARYAADAPALPRERLVALSPAELLAARFVLQPACAWIASPHPVCSIWSAHQPDSTLALDAIAPRAECALVTRRGWRVTLMPVTRGDAIALDALRAGADMDATISAALQVDPAFQFAPAFLRWLDAQVFSGFATAAAL